MGNVCCACSTPSDYETDISARIDSKLMQWQSEKQKMPLILLLSVDNDEQIELMMNLKNLYNEKMSQYNNILSKDINVYFKSIYESLSNLRNYNKNDDSNNSIIRKFKKMTKMGNYNN